MLNQNLSVVFVCGKTSLTLRLLCPFDLYIHGIRQDDTHMLWFPPWTSAVFEPFSVQVYDWSMCYDSFCTGPVANQSLSFCLAVMHTNSQQHILISPDSKAHQSQLTGPPEPARAILKKSFILSVRHMWIWADDFASYVWVFLLPPRHLCSGFNNFRGGGSQL